MSGESAACGEAEQRAVGALSLPLWGRWHGAAQRRSVTDEGSPPPAGLTAAYTFAILRLAAEPSSEPSERLAFPFGEGGTERRSAAP